MPSSFTSPRASERTSSYSTSFITLGGGARTGKGTSGAAIETKLRSEGLSVLSVDQGQKFRAMAVIALQAGEPLDSPSTLDHFLRSPQAQRSALALLTEVPKMSKDDIQGLLYPSKISVASARVARVPTAHQIATDLLQKQIRQGVEDNTDVIMIDGRAIEPYARRYADEQGLGHFVMGWYFTCDPDVAAKRSLGLPPEYRRLPRKTKKQLSEEAARINARNLSDQNRPVDPLRVPQDAYHLDLSTCTRSEAYDPQNAASVIIHTANRMAVVDTTPTQSIEEMTRPVTDVTMAALRAQWDLAA